jgi:hypothetical protein
MYRLPKTGCLPLDAIHKARKFEQPCCQINASGQTCFQKSEPEFETLTASQRAEKEAPATGRGLRRKELEFDAIDPVFCSGLVVHYY